jgi:methylmalonyl-CoA carboxyltransferase large subunit
MKTETVDWAHVVDTLGALRQEIVRLNERVAALESATGLATLTKHAAAAAEAPAPAPAAAAPPPPVPEELSEELVLTISAAIAAFLGKRAHIRQIRLLGSQAWAQQGRVSIQASHRLEVQHS